MHALREEEALHASRTSPEWNSGHSVYSSAHGVSPDVSISSDSSIHGIPQSLGQRGRQGSVERRTEAHAGLFDGLDELPYEEYLFNAERPYHPVFLTYYNPKLEQLFCDRRRRHLFPYRMYGVSFFTIVSLVLLLIDIPVLMECQDCSVFVVSVSVGLALQLVATAVLLWMLYVFKRSQSREGADVNLPIGNQLYDSILIILVSISNLTALMSSFC